MKFVSHILLLLSIVTYCQAQCDTPGSTFTTIEDAIELINLCDFSANKFNASCVSAACPLLATSGQCPYASNENLNLTALTSILSILNDCFQQKTTICDTPLANIPIPPLAASVSQVFDGHSINAACSLGLNKATVANLQDVSFALSPNQNGGPLNVVIDAPGITLNGVIQCYLTLAKIKFDLLNISSFITLGLSSTAAIDSSHQPPDVRVQVDNVTMDYRVGNFVPNTDSVIPFPESIESLFTSGVSSVWKSSGNPTAVANFYATFIAFGIQATKGNCPSP